MKRIKLFGVVVALMFSTQLNSLAQDSTYLSNEYAKALATYQRAQRYNDALLSKQALVEMSVLSPRDTSVLRSLAELYYNNRQFISSAIVAQDINAIYPTSIVGLEIQALSFENLRLYDKAVENYEKLWLQTEDKYVLFQIAYLQYSIDRFEESKNNLAILISKTTDEDMVQLNKSDGNVQDVKMMAAIENVKGLIAVAQGDNEVARGHFNKALELSPEFESPKLSLDEMK